MMLSIRNSLVEVMTKWPPRYSLNREELVLVAGTLADTLSRLYASAPDDVRDAHLLAAVDRLGVLGDHIFDGVNLPHDDSAFRAEIERRTAPMRDGRSIHLELGTFNVWPDSRTETFVREERIGDVVRLDMQVQFDLDVAGSVTAMPFADESIDRIYSNSLFEHVPYPHEIIREAYRVLRPGGVILTVVPFHCVEHGCPADYLRFTGQFFEQVGGDVGFSDILTETRACSGVYYTTHQLLKAAVAPERAHHPMAGSTQMAHVYSLLLLASLQTLDNYHIAQGASCWHTTSALMSKPGTYVQRSQTVDRSKPFIDRFKDLICPQSGLPLRIEGQEMVSLDGRYRYPIVDGKPNLFVMHGFNSSFNKRASSREALNRFNRQRNPLRALLGRVARSA